MNSKILSWRWALLFFLNILFFNSPAGSCGNDLAVGFPVVHTRFPNNYLQHIQGPETMSMPIDPSRQVNFSLQTPKRTSSFYLPLKLTNFFLDTFFCLGLAYIFWKLFNRNNYSQLFRGAIKGSLFYFTLANWFCFVLLMDFFSARNQIESFLLYSALPFYFIGIISGEIFRKLPFVSDEMIWSVRILLLPTFLLFFLVLYILGKGILWIRHSNKKASSFSI